MFFQYFRRSSELPNAVARLTHCWWDHNNNWQLPLTGIAIALLFSLTVRLRHLNKRALIC